MACATRSTPRIGDVMAAKETILSVENLHVRFHTLDGVVEAVKGINMEVKAGETVAVVGESGSG
jgi:ABC-type microcin C transport system duplicated ATPase subunit YejF